MPFLSAVVGAVGVITLTPDALWQVDQPWEYSLIWAGAAVLALLWITYKQHWRIIYLTLEPDIDRHATALVDSDASYANIKTKEQYEEWEKLAGSRVHEVTHRFRASLQNRLPGRMGRKWAAALTSEAIEQRSIGPVEPGFNSEQHYAHRVRQTLDALGALEAELLSRPSWRSHLRPQPRGY